MKSRELHHRALRSLSGEIHRFTLAKEEPANSGERVAAIKALQGLELAEHIIHAHSPRMRLRGGCNAGHDVWPCAPYRLALVVVGLSHDAQKSLSIAPGEHQA